MSITYKRLGAHEAVVGEYESIYIVPALTSTVISSIVVCNTGATSQTFRIVIMEELGASPAMADHIYYDVPILGNDTFIVTAGFTLSSNYAIKVRATSEYVVFSVFGSEIS